MYNLWIKVRADIWDHHKTHRLATALSISRVQAIGHLISLWHFVLANAWRKADLSLWGDVGIERAAQWQGPPGKFVETMREVGFLDGNVVHGWLENARKLVRDRSYKESRAKKARTRQRVDAEARDDCRVLATKNGRDGDGVREGEGDRDRDRHTDTDNESCSEASSEPPYLTFACLRGVKYDLTEVKLREYQQTFPAVDIRAESRRAWQWCEDNPARRKTIRGMPAFLSRWFTKEQDHPKARTEARDDGRARCQPGKYAGVPVVRDTGGDAGETGSR